MDRLWRHRWGLIGVLFIHLGFVMYSKNTVVIPYTSILQQEEEAFVDVDFIQPESQEMIAENFQSENITNTDYNQADKRTDLKGNYDARFDQKSVDQSIYEELKNMERQEFERLNKNRPAETNPSEFSDPNKQKNEKTNTTNSGERASGSAPKGATTAEYDLAGRRNEGYLPKPSYTCIGSGKLVVRIKVNRSGKVTSAKVDDAASSYTEECMKAGAEKYALRAKFEASATAEDPQEGTITYRYISQ